MYCFCIYIFTLGSLISSGNIKFFINIANDFKRESHFFQWHLLTQCRPQWQSSSSFLFLLGKLIDCAKSIFSNHWCPQDRQSHILLFIHSNGWKMSSLLFTAAACCSSFCLCPRSTNISCLCRIKASLHIIFQKHVHHWILIQSDDRAKSHFYPILLLILFFHIV